MRSTNLVNLNGKTINEKKALVSVDNRSFRYGDGCFETLKLINGKINLLEYHLDRLFASITTLQFEWSSSFTPAYIANAIIDLAQANGHQKLARIRLTIFAGDGGLYDGDSRRLNYLIQSWELNDANNAPNENGLVLGIYAHGFKAADALSNIKSNNFLLYSLAALHAKKEHWNDALVLNHLGNISDATIANIFIIKNENIVTPRLADGPINGTLRKHLLLRLTEIGYKVEEQVITAAMLSNADECFLSNAIYGIRWVGIFGNKQFTNKHFHTIYREIIKPLWAGQ